MMKLLQVSSNLTTWWRASSSTNASICNCGKVQISVNVIVWTSSFGWAAGLRQALHQCCWLTWSALGEDIGRFRLGRRYGKRGRGGDSRGCGGCSGTVGMQINGIDVTDPTQTFAADKWECLGTAQSYVIRTSN
jgi:hypothetical protein